MIHPFLHPIRGFARKASLIAIIALAAHACSLDIPLEDKVTDPWAITDAESSLKALSTVYSSYRHWQNMVLLTAMSDDCTPTPHLRLKPDLRNAYNFNEQGLMTLAGGFWSENYTTIMYANALTERIARIKNANENDRKQRPLIEKEANALKALCYFHLMQLFSPRYLPAEADKQHGAVYKAHVKLEYNPRMSLAATADTIRRLITPWMEEKAPSKNSIYRFSPLAARYLAAELELWTGNYEKAVAICEPEIDLADLDKTPENAYVRFWEQTDPTAKEAVFSIDYSAFKGANFFDDWNIDERDLLVVNNAVKYDEPDIRRAVTATPDKIHTIGGSRDVLKFGKYHAIRNASKHIRFVSVYRRADLIFICAEGYARTGKPEKARVLMNRYLKSRKAAPFDDTLQGDVLIKRIADEKQKEFLGEGKRFFDLKRLGNIPIIRNLAFDNPLTTISPDDFRLTLPIPLLEYKYNKAVQKQQNKGWEFLTTGV